jgi:hypothetical protein
MKRLHKLYIRIEDLMHLYDGKGSVNSTYVQAELSEIRDEILEIEKALKTLL